MEIWKTSLSASQYEVSSFGRIRRADSGRLRKLVLGRRWGYYLIGLRVSGNHKTVKVHRLVCEAFHGPSPYGKSYVAHGDGVRTNNAAANLRWATKAENIADMMKHGNSAAKRGSKNSNAKLTEADVVAIRAAPRRRGLLFGLAAQYGVSRNVVGNIRTKGSPCWPHVR